MAEEVRIATKDLQEAIKSTVDQYLDEKVSDVKADTESILDNFPIDAGGGIKNVQRGNWSESSVSRTGGTININISSVNTDKCFVITTLFVDDVDNSWGIGEISLSSTQLTLKVWHDSGGNRAARGSWQVIEFE